ncbi:MAG: DUF3795 domain-containing protein [Bacillota bacterium]|nr:DUF3795 domain-containing protein [Bacillota bacterium]
MNVRELTGPCGMDCFNCQVYEKNITKELIEILSKSTQKDPSEIPCKGCRAKKGGGILWMRECKTYKCASIMGVEFCFECSNFPCYKLLPCSSKADKFPHNMKIFNLCMIKRVGIEKWAKQSVDIRIRYFKGEFVPGLGPVIKK